MNFRRGFIPSILLLGLALGAAAQYDTDFGKLKVAKSDTAAGDKMLRAERYDQAEKHFRSAIDAEPSYPPAHLGLGSALVAQGRFPEAIEALRDAERRYVAWKLLLQETQMEHRRYTIDRQQQADDMLTEAKIRAQVASSTQGEGARPADTTLARLVQRLQLEVGELQVSRDKLEQIDAEDIGAIPAQVFYLEGVSHLRTGQRDDGIEMLEVALLLDDSHGLSHYNLAVALFSEGKAAQAKEHLDAAVAAGVTPPPAFVADVERAIAADGQTPG